MLALCSPEDFDHLAKFRWHTSEHKQRWQRVGNWYAFRFIELPRGPNNKRRRQKKYMHREVAERMGHDITGLVVDHKPEGNGTLDNRREHLRPATHKQNLCYSCHGVDRSDEW